jgi:hypothetical protein
MESDKVDEMQRIVEEVENVVLSQDWGLSQLMATKTHSSNLMVSEKLKEVLSQMSEYSACNIEFSRT